MIQTTLLQFRALVMLSLLGGIIAFGIVALRDGLGSREGPVDGGEFATWSVGEPANTPPDLGERISPSSRARPGPISATAVGPGGLIAVAESDGALRVSTPDGRELLRADAHHGLPITTLAFSPDGRRLISGGHDSEIGVWDLEARAERFRLHGHEHAINAISISRDGSAIASAGQETRILLWDGQSGRLKAILSGHGDFVNDVAFSPDGGRLGSAGADGIVLLWNSRTGAREVTLVGHRAPVTKLSFGGGGATLVTGASDGTVIVWDVARAAERYRLVEHRGAVVALALDADGGTLATASADNRIVVWSVVSGDMLASFAGPQGGVSSLTFDTDGRLQIASRSGSVEWEQLGKLPDRRPFSVR